MGEAKVKISQLPETQSVDGLYSLGVDGAGASVKFKASLLKGEPGKDGAQGQPGKDGAQGRPGKDGDTGTYIVDRREIEVGEFRLTSNTGEIEHPIYSQIAIITVLPTTAGSTNEYLISDDPLGCNLYFSIDSFVVSGGKSLRSEMFFSLYEIIKVYVDSDYSTKIVIRCRENTTERLNAYINVRYIKPYADKIEFDLECDTAVDLNNVTVEIPALKYDKKALVSLTTDDAHATTYSCIWAAINGRPVASRKWYHANQLAVGDVPAEIIETTLSKTLGYTDGCGLERRFRHGVAIWPHCKANDRTMMDTTNPVDPTAGNLYRFMTPYLQWGDLAEMIKYGTSAYYHNIYTPQFGADNVVENIIAGLQADCQLTMDRIGRGMKILARPDGNNTFIEASRQSNQILFSVSESSPGIDILPCSEPNLFNRVGLRFFPSASGNMTEQDVVKARFIAEYAKAKEQRKWFHFCCHNANMDWVNLLVWFNDTYGKDGSDDIWFANIDEVYEYMCLRNNALIRKTASGNKLHITVYIPKGQYFYYPEFSLIVGGAGTVSEVEPSENIVGLSYVSRTGDLLINASTDEMLLALAEEFTAKYEHSGKKLDRTDALYFVNQLKRVLRAGYMDRLRAVSPGAIALLNIVINTGLGTTTSRNVAVSPVYTGMPTDYRIGETSDLSNSVWIPYSGGSFDFTLSDGYGEKTIYLQLKKGTNETVVRNSSILYHENTTEIPLTGLSISGETTVTQGVTAQLSVSYIPANTTQKGVTWSSSSESVAIVNALGKVTALAAGNVVITARSSVNTAIAATHNITVNMSGSDKAATMVACYSWPDIKVDHILDSIGGKYLTIANENNNAQTAPNNKMYDMNTGLELIGWSRMSDAERKAYYSLDILERWGTAASYNADLSDLFETPLSYNYSYKYNGIAYPVIGWNLSNGRYKVSILSSTTQVNVTTSGGHIKINNVDQTMPDISLQNNKQWMEFTDIQVTTGQLVIMMYAETNKRIGFNAIKIEQI